EVVSTQESINSRTWMVIVLILFVIGIIGYVIWRLSSDVTDKFATSKQALEEQLVDEYSKVAESLNELILAAQTFGATTSNGTPDHRLALKLANEINTMERNMSLMDSAVRGYKQLKRSIENLKDNLAANGYDMAPLLGRKFDLGLNLQVINAVP